MKKVSLVVSILLIVIVIPSACSFASPQPTFTSTPLNTATIFTTPTDTPRPSSTPRPTRTPYLAGTQRAIENKTATQAYLDAWKLETQKYYDLGYLATTEGTYRKFSNFNKEWAQIRWYTSWIYEKDVQNFYMSAHFKWASAYRNADRSGCGFVFAIQKNLDKYSVFLDRNGILFNIFEQSYGYYRPVGITRGTGILKFDNPYDKPAEADFTLIVKDAYAWVLVNDEVAGEYTLSTKKLYKGGVGPAILSGTNKDFGTRCDMSNFRIWIQNVKP